VSSVKYELGFISQKTTFFIVTAVKTSNLTSMKLAAVAYWSIGRDRTTGHAHGTVGLYTTWHSLGSGTDAASSKARRLSWVYEQTPQAVGNTIVCVMTKCRLVGYIASGLRQHCRSWYQAPSSPCRWFTFRERVSCSGDTY
jgi:hypothetical protein